MPEIKLSKDFPLVKIIQISFFLTCFALLQISCQNNRPQTSEAVKSDVKLPTGASISTEN